MIEAMQRYQLITENSTDLITKHETTGIIRYASPISVSVIGTDHTALLGHSIFEFVHPEDCDVVRAAFVEAEQSNAVPTIIYRVRHADQHYVWFETTMRLMKGA